MESCPHGLNMPGPYPKASGFPHTRPRVSHVVCMRFSVLKQTRQPPSYRTSSFFSFHPPVVKFLCVLLSFRRPHQFSSGYPPRRPDRSRPLRAVGLQRRRLRWTIDHHPISSPQYLRMPDHVRRVDLRTPNQRLQVVLLACERI